MSAMKRFAEEVSVDMGYDGEINDEVLAEAQRRLDRKIKLRCQNNPGAGRELQAYLPTGMLLDKVEGAIVRDDGWVTIWYERWVQFPSEEWEAMQDDVMAAIQTVVEKWNDRFSSDNPVDVPTENTVGTDAE